MSATLRPAPPPGRSTIETSYKGTSRSRSWARRSRRRYSAGDARMWGTVSDSIGCALVASVGEASPSSVRAGGERDPPGRLRVHRRAIDVGGAAPGGAGGAVRHGVDPPGRLLVRRSGPPGSGARVGAGAELPLHGVAQLSPRAHGGTRRAPAGDGRAATAGGSAHATRRGERCVGADG